MSEKINILLDKMSEKDLYKASYDTSITQNMFMPEKLHILPDKMYSQ